MAREIDYDSLELAMNSGGMEGSFYFDTGSGQVVPVSEDDRAEARHFVTFEEISEPAVRLAWCEMWEAGRVGDAVVEADIPALQARVDDYLGRFLMVPQIGSKEGYADMEDFVETVQDDHLHSLLATALSGPGAFRRFKNVLLNYPDERQRWFDFRDARMRQRVDDWLEEKGIQAKE